MKFLVLVTFLVYYCAVHISAIYQSYDTLPKGRIAQSTYYETLEEDYDGDGDDYAVLNFNSDEFDVDDDDDDYTSNEDDSNEHSVVKRDVTSQVADSNTDAAAPKRRTVHKMQGNARHAGQRKRQGNARHAGQRKRQGNERHAGQHANRKTEEPEVRRPRSEVQRAKRARHQQHILGLDSQRLIFGICHKLKMVQHRVNATISPEQNLTILGNVLQPVEACCNKVALARKHCFKEYIAKQCQVTDKSNNQDDDKEDDGDEDCCEKNVEGRKSCILENVKDSLKSHVLLFKREHRQGHPSLAPGHRVRKTEHTPSQ